MKKYVLLAATASLILTSCAQKIAETVSTARSAYYAEDMETSERNVGPFSGISSSTAIITIVKYSPENRVEVRSNYLQDIETKVEKGILKIGYKPSERNRTNAYTEVTVYTPAIEVLDASSAADIKVDDPFSSEKLVINVSSAASVTGNFRAKTLDINASSASTFRRNIQAENAKAVSSSSSLIEISGRADRITAQASSTGKIDLKKLAYREIDKETSSMGRVVLP